MKKRLTQKDYILRVLKNNKKRGLEVRDIEDKLYFMHENEKYPWKMGVPARPAIRRILRELELADKCHGVWQDNRRTRWFPDVLLTLHK